MNTSVSDKQKSSRPESSRRPQRIHVNAKLFLILTVLLIVGGVTVHFVHGYMVNRNAKDLYDRAVQLLKEADEAKAEAQTSEDEEERAKLTRQVNKKRNDAINYLGRYVQLEPDAVQAWLLYAESADDYQTNMKQRPRVQGILKAALRKLESAQNNGDLDAETTEKISKLQRRLIDVSMEIATLPNQRPQFKFAEGRIKDLLEEDANKKDPQLHQWLGMCLEIRDQYKAAADKYHEAYSVDATFTDAYKNLILIIFRHSKDIKFEDYDPAVENNATLDDVLDRIGERMVQNGRPVYEAYYNRAVLCLTRALSASSVDAKEKLLAQAREDSDRSVEELKQASQQPSKPSDEKSQEDPATNIEPIIAAMQVYIESSSAAINRGDEENSKAYMNKAREYANAARAKSPSDLRSYRTLARLESLSQAEKVLEEQDYSETIRIIKDGLKQIDKAQTLATPIELELRSTLVEALIDAGYGITTPGKEEQNEELETALSDFRQRGASAAQLDYLNAMKLFKNAEWKAAEEALKDVRNRVSTQREKTLRVNVMLAECYRQLGNPQLRLHALEEAKAIAPADPGIRYQLATQLDSMGRIDDALEEIKLVDPRVQGRMYLLANLQIRRVQNRPKAQRDWPSLIERLKADLKQFDELGLQGSDEETFLKIETARAMSLFALDSLSTNPSQGEKILDDAEAFIRSAIAEQPDDARYWSRLVNLQYLRSQFSDDPDEKARRVKTAFETLQEAEKTIGDDSSLRIVRGSLLAKMHAEDEDLAPIVQQIEALGENTDAFDEGEIILLWKNLGTACLELKAPDATRRLWTKVLERQPINVADRFLLQKLEYTEDRGYSLDLISAKSNEEKAEIKSKHETLIAEMNQLAESIREIEGPGAPYGNIAEATVLLAEVEFEIQLNPSQDPKLKPELQEKLTRARTLLTEAEKAQPRHARVKTMLGHVEYLLGREPEAISWLNDAADLGALDSDTVNLLIRLLDKYNRKEEVNNLLDRVQNRRPELLLTEGEMPGTVNLRNLGADVLAKQGDYEKAADLLQDYSPNRENDCQYHLRMGKINFNKASKEDRLAEASDIEPHFRKAVELAPEVPLTWQLLVDYLQLSGRNSEAQQELDKAKQALKDLGDHVAIARLDQIVGHMDSAISEYEAALQQDPENYQAMRDLLLLLMRMRKMEQAELLIKTAISRNGQEPKIHSLAADFYSAKGDKQVAIGYLNKILNREEEIDSNLVKHARRRKAVLMGQTTVYQESINALKLIDENLVDEQDLQDLRAKVRILSLHQTPDAHEMLIDIYKQIDALGNLTAPERFRLAQLHRLRGEPDQAKSQLLNLINTEETKARFLAEYIDIMIDQRELDSIDIWMQRLEQSGSGTMTLATLKASRFMALDDPQSAADVLLNFLESRTKPKFDPEQALRIAELYRANPQPVEELLKAFAEFVKPLEDPEADKTLNEAQKLIDDGNTAQGVRLIAGYTGKVSALAELYSKETLAIAKIMEELTIENESDNNQILLEKAERIYRDFGELALNPSAKLELARFYARRGRITDAIDICDSLEEKASIVELAALKVALLKDRQATDEEEKRIEQSVAQAVEKNPESLQLMLQMAIMRDYQGRDAEAIKWYRKVLEKSPKNPLIDNNLAWLLVMGSDSEDPAKLAEASKLIDEAISIRGPAPDLLDTQATIFMKQKKFDPAITNLQNAIKASSEKKTIYFHLAQAFYGSGDFEKAREAMRTAIQLGLRKADLHPREGDAYRDLLKRLGLTVNNEA